MVVEEIIHEEIDVSLEDNLEDDDDISYEYLGTISKIFYLFQTLFKYVLQFVNFFLFWNLNQNKTRDTRVPSKTSRKAKGFQREHLISSHETCKIPNEFSTILTCSNKF